VQDFVWFDKTWIFQMIKRSWHILCTCILYICKLWTLFLPDYSFKSVINIVQLANMLCYMSCHIPSDVRLCSHCSQQ